MVAVGLSNPPRSDSSSLASSSARIVKTGDRAAAMCRFAEGDGSLVEMFLTGMTDGMWWEGVRGEGLEVRKGSS